MKSIKQLKYILLFSGLCLSIGGCGAFSPPPSCTQFVDAFYRHLNHQNIDSLSMLTEDSPLSLDGLQAARNEHGEIASYQYTGIHYVSSTSGSTVTLSYATRYADGFSCNEEFIFSEINDTTYRLSNYQQVYNIRF